MWFYTSKGYEIVLRIEPRVSGMLCKHTITVIGPWPSYAGAGHTDSLGTDNQTAFSCGGPQSLASCPTPTWED